jgi:hypothetical protein
MSHNFIARSIGAYQPGEFDLGIHNPDLIQPDYEVDCGSLTSPDAYYNYAIELTRNSNLDRDVSEERNNPVENRVMYNKMADILSGVGPRSSVRDLLPSTELLQEVGPPKHEHKPNFEGLRARFYEASKKRLRRYENITNIVESPLRRDMVRYAWNLNPRLRGQVQINPIDNELTYLQNHTTRNKSFTDKLMSSIVMETELLENQEYTHKKLKQKLNNNYPKNNLVQIPGEDITMDLKMNRHKEVYNKCKDNKPEIEHYIGNGIDRVANNKYNKYNNFVGNNSNKISNEFNNNLQDTQINNKLGPIKKINNQDRKNTHASFEYKSDEDNKTYKLNKYQKSSNTHLYKNNNNIESRDEETYKLGFKRDHTNNRVLMRDNKLNESLIMGPDSRKNKTIFKNDNHIIKQNQDKEFVYSDDITIMHNVTNHN